MFLSRLNCNYFPSVYPTFVLRPKNTTAFVDDHLWLHCNASGDPKPKISWSKEEQGGDKLDKERFFSLPNGTLHIKKVQLSDQGRYYCIAANHAEMKQSKFSLRVKRKFPVLESHNIHFLLLTWHSSFVFFPHSFFFFFGGWGGGGGGVGREGMRTFNILSEQFQSIKYTEANACELPVRRTLQPLDRHTMYRFPFDFKREV